MDLRRGSWRRKRGEAVMNEVVQRIVEINGIGVNIAEQGSGPLVLLCHGFPESWYSWRRQIVALASNGFHAVAPDMRGYGRSARPEAIDQYTIFHMVGDLIGLLDALNAPSAFIVGHDLGARTAWNAAMMRPDRFKAVVALSVPFPVRGKAPPTSLMPRTAESQFYQLYFQEPGVAEREFERDTRWTMRNMLYAGSGEALGAGVAGGQIALPTMVSKGGGFLQGGGAPAKLPEWLSEQDVEFYAAEFQRSGFRGPLNYYRNFDRNWELLAPFSGASVSTPALYVAGDRDPVIVNPYKDQLLGGMRHFVPQLRQPIFLPGCGHWTQQERADEVNVAIIEFLRSLPG
jgi:pimeloyl-ACP methyl ester carboxylesterase